MWPAHEPSDERTIMENVLAVSPSRPAAGGARLVWTGRILSALIVAFLLFDAAMKLVAVAPVVEATTRLGYAAATIRPMGAVLLIAALLHAMPRTAVLGALLVTAYLGGATATQVRAGDPFWFPVAMGVLLWIGLVLRHPRLCALVLAPAA
jgi:hypothetical protein